MVLTMFMMKSDHMDLFRLSFSCWNDLPPNCRLSYYQYTEHTIQYACCCCDQLSLLQLFHHHIDHTVMQCGKHTSLKLYSHVIINRIVLNTTYHIQHSGTNTVNTSNQLTKKTGHPIVSVD